MLLRNLTSSDKKIAIIHGPRELSYAELNHKAEIFAYFIRETHNPEPGSFFICSFENPVHAVISFFALIKLGCIPALVSSSLSDAELKKYSETICSAKIFTSEDMIESESFHLDNQGKELGHPKLEEQNEEEILFCCFTSGTTGQPCAITHSLKDVHTMCELYGNKVIDLTNNDKFFSTSGLHFAYGLNSLLFGICFGATTILPRENDSAASLSGYIKKTKPSVIFSTPRVYASLLNLPVPSSCFDSIRLFVSAGEKLPTTIYDGWIEKYGSSIVDGIGCTETLTTFITNHPNDTVRGSSGKAIHGVEVALRNSEGYPCGTNEPGEMWVKTNTFPTSYVNNSIATKIRFHGDWFNTYDICTMDANGFFYHQGRKNDLIYKQGYWVYPQKIENRLLKHEKIQEVAIAGYKNDNLETVLACFVLLSGKHQPTTQDLNALNEGSIDFTPAEKIDYYCYVSSLPKTMTGKLKRHELLAGPYFVLVENQLKRAKEIFHE